MWKRIIEFIFNFFKKPLPSPAPQPEPQPQPEPPQPEPIPIKIDLAEKLIEEAKNYLYVREDKGKNRSKDIDAWLKQLDIAVGSPWCMAFVQNMIINVCKKYDVSTRISKKAHCQTVWFDSPEDLKKQTPSPGCLVIWKHGNTSEGHVGIVIKQIDKNTIETIEGNTSGSKAIVRNGDGVYIKQRDIKGSYQMKVIGFLQVWDSRYVYQMPE